MNKSDEIWFKIKNDMPKLNRQTLYDYTKFAVYSIYSSLAKDEEVKINCSKELIEKLKDNKKSYRISSNIDEVNIQFIDLYDYVSTEKEKFIKVYISVYFYDNRENNTIISQDQKYWNDIWIVTYRGNGNIEKKTITRCQNCGAVMNYNKNTNIYKCEYCNNTIRYDSAEEALEISDIEVKE